MNQKWLVSLLLEAEQSVFANLLMLELTGSLGTRAIDDISEQLPEQ